MWLITDHDWVSRGRPTTAPWTSTWCSASFFNALPIRRTGLHTTTDKVTLPVVYVHLPDRRSPPPRSSYGLGGGGSN